MRALLHGNAKAFLVGSSLFLSLACALFYARIQGGESGGPESGAVQGKVTLDIPGTTFSTIGPMVVFLEPRDPAAKPQAPQKPALMEQKDLKFIPDFLVVSVGQPLEMPNLDKVSHNAFSFSKPNTFDLGVYPRGESRKVTFQHSGVVDLYCSVHSKMNASVYVAPTPYHSAVSPTGSFEVRDVPPGKYTLKTWNRKLPEAKQEVEVVRGKGPDVVVRINLGK